MIKPRPTQMRHRRHQAVVDWQLPPTQLHAYRKQAIHECGLLKRMLIVDSLLSCDKKILLLLDSQVNLYFRRSKCRGLHKMNVSIPRFSHNKKRKPLRHE